MDQRNSNRQLIPNTVFLQKDTSQNSRKSSPRDKKNQHSRSQVRSDNNTRIILRSLDKYSQETPNTKARNSVEVKSLRELNLTKFVVTRPPRVERVYPIRGPHPSAMDWFSNQSLDPQQRAAGTSIEMASSRSVEAEPKQDLRSRKPPKSDGTSHMEYYVRPNPSVSWSKERLDSIPSTSLKVSDQVVGPGGEQKILYRRRRLSPATSASVLPNRDRVPETRDRIKEISEMIRLQNLPDFTPNQQIESHKQGKAAGSLFFYGDGSQQSKVSSIVEFGWKLKDKHRRSFHGDRVQNFLDRATLDIKLRAPAAKSFGGDKDSVDRNKQLEQEIINDFKKMVKRGFLN